MFNIASSKVFLALAVLFLFFKFNQAAFASEHETACFENVQDKIDWNYDAKNHWDPENIKTLCQGTTKPKQPGECFQKVMAGKLKWGSGDNWKWQNAVSLCSGTDNADERIACFEGRVKDNVDWNEAIMQCQSSGKLILK